MSVVYPIRPSRALLALPLLAVLACQTVREIEEQPTVQDEFMQKSSFELDDDLCWQGAEASAATDAAVREAHDRCMAEKGWADSLPRD